MSVFEIPSINILTGQNVKLTSQEVISMSENSLLFSPKDEMLKGFAIVTYCSKCWALWFK